MGETMRMVTLKDGTAFESRQTPLSNLVGDKCYFLIDSLKVDVLPKKYRPHSTDRFEFTELEIATEDIASISADNGNPPDMDPKDEYEKAKRKRIENMRELGWKV